MMRLPPFQLSMPESIQDAVSLLAESPADTRVVAGGTDLWPNMKRRHQSARHVVSLRNVEALRHSEATPDALTFGAMTPLSAIEHDPRVRERVPALARAAASISSPAIRNAGTLGGNLCLDTRCTYYNQNEEWRCSIDYCMKERGSTCWVAPSSPRCWAISASDTAPLLVAVGARAEVVGPEGKRTLPVADLYRDDGIDYLTLSREELLTEIHVPLSRDTTSSFWKLRRRGSIDFAVLSVAASVRLEQGVVRGAKIVLGAVASAPIDCSPAAETLIGRRLDEETIREAAHAARKDATPLDNTDFTLQWRSKMVVHYVEGALRELAGLPYEGLLPRHPMIGLTA